ncbi:Acb2/Tad1 domain-containing protein [Rhodococcus sp. NPDC003994]
MSYATEKSTADIENRFAYHRPASPVTIDAHETIRRLCGDLAHELDRTLAPGREKSTALTNLEQVMFWSNASIARPPLPR